MEATAAFINDGQLVLETKGMDFVADSFKGGKEDPHMPAPVDYFTAAFAGCVASYAARILQNHQIRPEGLKVSIQAEYAEDPHRIGAFHVQVEVPPGVPENLMRVVRRAAEMCTLHNTLTHPPKVDFNYEIAAEKGSWRPATHF